MCAVIELSRVRVIGPMVAHMDQLTVAASGMQALARFKSFREAVTALRLLRRADWISHAELLFDDEDFLTIQVLARKIEKLNARSIQESENQKVKPVSDAGKSGFTGALVLGDLL